jgi:hypothetical protein
MNHESPAGVRNFYPLHSLQASACAHPAVHSSLAGVLPLGVKQLGLEADHSPTYEVMYQWNHTSNPPCDFMHKNRPHLITLMSLFCLQLPPLFDFSTFSLPVCYKYYSRPILPYQWLSHAISWLILRIEHMCNLPNNNEERQLIHSECQEYYLTPIQW